MLKTVEPLTTKDITAPEEPKNPLGQIKRGGSLTEEEKQIYKNYRLVECSKYSQEIINYNKALDDKKIYYIAKIINNLNQPFYFYHKIFELKMQ